MKLLSKLKKAISGGSKKPAKPIKKAIKKTIKPVKKTAKPTATKQAKKTIIKHTIKHKMKQHKTKHFKTKHPKTNHKSPIAHTRVNPKTAKLKAHKTNRKQSIVKTKETKTKKISARQQKEQIVKQLALQQLPTEEKKTIKYQLLPGADNERVRMLLPILKELTKKGVISDWVINFAHTKANNLYVEKNFIVEDEQSTIREDLTLTIYERFKDGTMGEAQLPIITTDATDARQQIMDAKQTCEFARKKAFNLPQPQEGITNPEGHDQTMLEMIFSGNNSITQGIYQQVRQYMLPISDVKANCFEVLASASTMRVLNSNGVDVSFHKTKIYFEMVLTCKAKEEREFLVNKSVVSPDQLDIQSILEYNITTVRDATTAQQNQGFTGDVLLSAHAVAEVFAPDNSINPMIMHSSARLATMEISCLKIGQPIGQLLGEPFNISSNPLLPLGAYTAPVDEDGTPLKPVELFRNGVFTNWLATARYAQYLGVPVTGNIGNIQLSPGATREQHLRSNNYFEIIAFSWFNPDPFSGDFSAEIRLGYHWVNGRKMPFRGGTFVGNIFKAMCNARFSKEVAQSGAYYGPRAIIFRSGTIIGNE